MSTEAIDRSTLVREYTRELHNRNTAVFVGAGLSVPSGYVDWKRLLRDAMKDLKLDPRVETDLVTVAQYYCNQTGNRNGLTQAIVNCFSETKQPTENHRILARLPIGTYWTTNYDRLIERALEDANKVPDVKYTKEHLSVTRLDRDVLVYKMHGDVDHASDAVISKDDYEKYPFRMQDYLAALRGDLIAKTFLFLGFSFTDPNIDYVLSRVRAVHEGNQRQHYSIHRRVKKERHESVKQYEYRRRKQEYFVRDMKRFGVQTVLVDEFGDITKLLHDIEAQYRRRSVFISGAAHEYGAWRPEDAQEFLYKLGYTLSRARDRIISGFGHGVGGAILNGCLANLSEAGKTVADEYIMMRPFPQTPTGKKKLPELWTEYRKQMVQHAGIAIFLFGNKLRDGKVVLSNGMRQEFDLCAKAGVYPIPIGATGFMAEALWRVVWSDLAKYYPGSKQSFRQAFKALGDGTKKPEKLLSIVERLVDQLQGG